MVCAFNLLLVIEGILLLRLPEIDDLFFLNRFLLKKTVEVLLLHLEVEFPWKEKLFDMLVFGENEFIL